VANCKDCKAITSLLFSGVGCVVPILGLKVSFSKLKMLNSQHWPSCQSSIISASLKITVHLELGNLTAVCSRQLGTWKK
jgi:hypothetical protein